MPKSEKFKCYCGEWRFKNAFFIIDEVREKVCQDLPCYGEIDNKKYCVLHYPNKDKTEDFDLIFQERCEEDSWDFRMVYFPKTLTYENEEFNKRADFKHATFADGVDFKYCKFNGMFEFFDSIFLQDAFFSYSHFYGQVNFNSVDFREYGYFAGVTFHPKSYPSFNQTKFKKGMFSEAKFEKPDNDRKVEFCKATFSEIIDFSSAEFLLKADFKDSILPKSGRTDFESVRFHKSVSFENVEFFDADFKNTKFCYENNAFEKTIFKYCKFDKSVSFVSAEFFQHTDFGKSTFQNAHFEEVTFSGNTNFRESQFSGDVFFNDSRFGYKDGNRIKSAQVNFDGADFGNKSRVFFDNTWFSWHTSFNYVKFNGYLLFKGSFENPFFDNVFEKHAFGGLLDLTYTTIEKPEKVYFQDVRLRPSWFVNTVFDLRKVNLIDIDWGDGSKSFLKTDEELKIVENRVKHNTKNLLAITFRQFADNAENNNRFEEASNFRRKAMEIEWLEKKELFWNWVDRIPIEAEKLKKRFGDFVVSNKTKKEYESTTPSNLFGIFRKNSLILHGLYRITSFYGEKSNRAFWWLAGIVLFSAFLYWTSWCKFPNGNEERSLEFIEAIFYSLRVMVLQRPEPFPINNFAKGVLAIESVLAPLQLALLALAIRRKFMR